ncbi:MAG: ThiF family adenylyltransferase [Promethearchaeota archaeon]
MSKRELTLEEREITKRQKLISGWDQQALKDATVFIAGVGALGCEIAKDLTLMGVGKLILCDLDTIETSNLSRQMLFYKGDEGRPKAEVAAERLKKMNPFIEIEYYFKPIQELPLDLYKSCDVIIAALDNIKARMDLNKICLQIKRPMIEGGTVGMEGHVQVILPENTRDLNGDIIEYGNRDQIVESLVDEKLWSLDENEYADYYAAQEEIEKLEEQIEKIRESRIEPVINKVREEVEKEVDEHPEKYFNFTPCYRCVVPIPPAKKAAAACTLKGIPRNREQCALRADVLFYNKYNRKVDFTNMDDVLKLTEIAQQELENLRKRVLEENISPEERDTITPEEIEERKRNIIATFGPDFSPEDMENIIENKIPAVQSVSSIISSIESQEALKLIFLMHGVKVGEIMDPPYINYNGTYGQFDPVPISRRPDCVACGKVEGIENLSILIRKDTSFANLFALIEQEGYKLDPDKWAISNPLTKAFIYLPNNPHSPTLIDNCIENGLKPGAFYKFTTAPQNAVNGIHTLNVQVLSMDEDE